MKRLIIFLPLLGIIAVAVALAADVGTLNTFTADTTVSSADVNKNFSDIKTAVNSKQDRATGPGVAFSGTTRSPEFGGGAVADVDTRITGADTTMSIPADGFVILTAKLEVNIVHAAGILNQIIVSANNSATVGVFKDFSVFEIPAGAAIGLYRFAINTLAVIPVTGGTTETFHVDILSIDADAGVGQGKLVAMFFPTRL